MAACGVLAETCVIIFGYMVGINCDNDTAR
jgi:hypothetical protein